MIKSMTGFGKGQAENKFGGIKVETRSVNHKFLEISVKLPESLLDFEDRTREIAGRFVKRGKVNVNIIHEDGSGSAETIAVDEKLAAAYYRMLMNLKKKIRLEGSVRLDQIITLPGVIRCEPKGAISIKLWPCVEQALTKALKDLDASRQKEGRAIYADLKKRIVHVEKALTLIKERSRINVRMYKEKLKKSIRQLSNEAAKFDKGKLEEEVALYAKNSDVTEEITRIAAHVKNLEDTLTNGREVGKKLDFIAQELNREINTVGSKAGDFKISQKVIQVKSEIEKLREQAKNIE